VSVAKKQAYREDRKDTTNVVAVWLAEDGDWLIPGKAVAGKAAYLLLAFPEHRDEQLAVLENGGFLWTEPGPLALLRQGRWPFASAADIPERISRQLLGAAEMALEERSRGLLRYRDVSEHGSAVRVPTYPVLMEPVSSANVEALHELLAEGPLRLARPPDVLRVLDALMLPGVAAEKEHLRAAYGIDIKAEDRDQPLWTNHRNRRYWVDGKYMTLTALPDWRERFDKAKKRAAKAAARRPVVRKPKPVRKALAVPIWPEPGTKPHRHSARVGQINNYIAAALDACGLKCGRVGHCVVEHLRLVARRVRGPWLDHPGLALIRWLAWNKEFGTPGSGTADVVVARALRKYPCPDLEELRAIAVRLAEDPGEDTPEAEQWVRLLGLKPRRLVENEKEFDRPSGISKRAGSAPGKIGKRIVKLLDLHKQKQEAAKKRRLAAEKRRSAAAESRVLQR
jgi:hypothetical protein